MKNLRRLFYNTLAILASLIMLIPICLIFINALKTKAQASSMGMDLPTTLQWSNFTAVIEKGKLVGALENSMLYASTATFIGVTASAMAAYVLSRNRSRLNRFLYFFLILGIAMPTNFVTLTRVMQFTLLNNTKLGIVLLYAAAHVPLNILLIYAFIETLPRELDEAATIDGCSPLQLFFSVIYPLLTPVLLTAAVLNILDVWNEFLYPLYYLNNSALWPMTLSIYNFFGQYQADWSLVSANVVLTILPIIIIYLLAQRFVIFGTVAGTGSVTAQPGAPEEPPPGAAGQPAAERAGELTLQEDILNKVVTGGLLVSLAGLFLQITDLPRAGLYGLLVLSFLVAWNRKNAWPVRWRAGTVIGALYVAALVSLGLFGISGSGALFLALAAMLATFFFGSVGGYAAAGLAALIWLGPGLLALAGVTWQPVFTLGNANLMDWVWGVFGIALGFLLLRPALEQLSVAQNFAVLVSQQKIQLEETRANLLKQATEIRLLNERLKTENMRMEAEMELAQRIQTSLLPPPLIHPELAVAARMLPADEVGGDYYDFQPLPNGMLWVCIGDVSGHGVTPGLIMMMAQTICATLISHHVEKPSTLVALTNEILYHNVQERLQADHFMTFSALRYLGQGRFIYAGAHLDSIIHRAATGQCEWVPTAGLWLNVVNDIHKESVDQELTLNIGDTLILYTDGLTEAFNAQRQLLDMSGLAAIVQKHAALAPEALCAAVFQDVLAWSNNVRADDMTLVVMRRTH